MSVTRTKFILPEGWESWVRNKHETIIDSLHYYLTLDWERREIRAGIGSFSKPINKTKYEGRDWQGRMIADAIAHLEKLEATTPR